MLYRHLNISGTDKLSLFNKRLQFITLYNKQKDNAPQVITCAKAPHKLRAYEGKLTFALLDMSQYWLYFRLPEKKFIGYLLWSILRVLNRCFCAKMSRQRKHGAVEDLEYNNSPTLPKAANQEATKRYRSSKYILIGRNICIF